VGLKSENINVTEKLVSRFRRTLVGLKSFAMSNQIGADEMFQTHPCGVEVAVCSYSKTARSGFRRTLVGLKLYETPTGSPPRWCFRRTLVGLKWDQWDTLGVLLVSDAPLWG